jgi:hypothetical protein
MQAAGPGQKSVEMGEEDSTLKGIKMLWTEDKYNDPESQIFIITVDGTVFKVWKRKHATMRIDKGQYSHKFNHGALKY